MKRLLFLLVILISSISAALAQSSVPPASQVTTVEEEPAIILEDWMTNPTVWAQDISDAEKVYLNYWHHKKPPAGFDPKNFDPEKWEKSMKEVRKMYLEYVRDGKKPPRPPKDIPWEVFRHVRHERHLPKTKVEKVN